MAAVQFSYLVGSDTQFGMVLQYKQTHRVHCQKWVELYLHGVVHRRKD